MFFTFPGRLIWDDAFAPPRTAGANGERVRGRTANANGAFGGGVERERRSSRSTPERQARERVRTIYD